MRYLFLILPFLTFAQQIKSVDFKTCNAAVSVNFAERKVTGHCEYVFEVMSPIDTIRIDAVNMAFSDVEINGKKAGFKVSATALNLYKGYKKGKNKISFDYTARPKQAMYFVGEPSDPQIWTQGQGKNTSHWLPSFNDVNEKVVFNLSATYDKGFEVISGGMLKSAKNIDGQVRWSYQMEHPMSSYLVMLAIGKFTKHTEVSRSGIALEQYVSVEDQSRLEPTYRNSKTVFDYLEREIGVGYPWKIYKQIPVKDFLYGGMENTSATIFTRDYVVDEIGYNDKDYLNVNAHELAHQWFGDMVTAKNGKHHWLQEGFATYYALLAERAVYGDDYFYSKLYDYAEELEQAEKSDSIPILDEKASSLTFYKKGAWALHVLRENIGEENFRKAVRSYIEKHAFKNVETEDFLSELRAVSRYDISGFSDRWLLSGKFPSDEAIRLLKKNPSMRQLFEFGEFVSTKDATLRDEEMLRVMESNVYVAVKREILYQSASILFEQKQPLIRAALATNDIKLRQAVAQTIGVFPESFYGEFATLLDDKSYVTQELAMAILWKLFPSKHGELLEKMRGRVGTNDKNLRIQWITLALMEKNYRTSEKVQYYDELLDYASAKYESPVRQNALENLIFIGPNDKNAMKLLVNPLVHHKWQFAKFAKDKIRSLVKFIAPQHFYEKLLPELPDDERAALQKLLDEKQSAMPMGK